MRQHERMLRLHRTMQLAAWLVPQQQRAAWRDEWIAELTFMLRESPHTAQQYASGLFADALAMRQIGIHNWWRAIDWRSPRLCLQLLIEIFALLSACALSQSHTRHLIGSSWGAITFSFFVAFAIFTIPSTVVVSRFSARDPYEGDAASARQRTARWAFLGGKLILLVLSNYLLALELILPLYRVIGLGANFFLLVCGMLLNIIAIGWAFNDQRERCPTCMRLLRSPAYMGTPSWSLLRSNATEEMCDQGHGLLHQPHWQTSWYNNARWFQLDPTWQELFRP